MQLCVRNEAVWDFSNMFRAYGPFSLAGKLRRHTKSPCPFTYLSWVLAQLILALLWVLFWGFKPSWDRLARVLSRCLRACSEAPSSLPMGSSFKKKPHAGLDHRTGSVAMAPLWHTGVSDSSPGQAVATEAKLPSVCSSTACIHARMCMFVFPRVSPHASVYVALSPFKIADKCRSLCLASLCMRTHWLGLQAVVQE